jgi:hypothetical protein
MPQRLELRPDRLGLAMAEIEDEDEFEDDYD